MVTFLCSVRDVEPDSVRQVEAGGRKFAVVRVGETAWYVLDDLCSHAEASLSEGEVFADETCIECPRHAAAFSLETGEPLDLPATEPVQTYKVKVEGSSVFADLEI